MENKYTLVGGHICLNNFIMKCTIKCNLEDRNVFKNLKLLR